jgi:hypothetical protein
MDLLVAFLLALLSAGFTAVLISYNVRQALQPPVTMRATYAGKWRLPEPGGNLELYSKTKRLLDTLERERNEARRERDVALQKLTESGDEIERLESKLSSAKSILKSWSHPGMEIRVRKRPRRESQQSFLIL